MHQLWHSFIYFTKCVEVYDKYIFIGKENQPLKKLTTRLMSYKNNKITPLGGKKSKSKHQNLGLVKYKSIDSMTPKK